MTLTEQLQTNIRASTSTVGQYWEDWHALCDLAGIAKGHINGRILAYYSSFNSGATTFSAAYNYFLFSPSSVTGGLLSTQITAMFAAGEQGAWYDPSDFSTMFQDSAGTIAVTAVGQPVGMIKDKSGRGNHATQATSANRPLIQQDTGGRWNLAFDGVSACLNSSSINLAATAQLTAFVGVRKTSDAATALAIQTTAASGSFYLATTASANSGVIQADAGGSTAAATNSPNSYPSPQTAVLTMQADIAAPALNLRVNGSLTSGSASMGTGTFGNLPMSVGSGVGNYWMKGSIYSVILRGATCSAAQITSGEAYVNSKTGAY